MELAGLTVAELAEIQAKLDELGGGMAGRR